MQLAELVRVVDPNAQDHPNKHSNADAYSSLNLQVLFFYTALESFRVVQQKSAVLTGCQKKKEGTAMYVTQISTSLPPLPMTRMPSK